MLESLLERFRQGDRCALARLLTIAARGENLDEIAAALSRGAGFQPAQDGSAAAAGRRPIPRSRVVAFTGSGGVGKSSLLGKLIDVVLAQPHKVAVLACDPQSPLSGGALLGDRFRMGSHDDDRLFIRSLAALSGHSALADHLPLMIRLLETFGFDAILLETVGSGQGDTAVRALADVVVLLLQPESGDDLQWEKAGLLEVADIIVIHKADLPGADQTAAQVRAALDLSTHRDIPVVPVSSKAGKGLAELWQAIEACPSRRDAFAAGQELLHLAQAELADRFRARASAPDLQVLVKDWHQGQLSAQETVSNLLSALAKPGKEE